MAAELRRLALPIDADLAQVIRDFDCVGQTNAKDPVAENVCGFLNDERYAQGLRHGLSATYLLLDVDAAPPLLGYTTLTLDSVRLTKTEKQRMEDVEFSHFGALRIQMLGVDHRHQCQGHGSEILRRVTGLARKLSENVAVRYLLADANVRKNPARSYQLTSSQTRPRRSGEHRGDRAASRDAPLRVDPLLRGADPVEVEQIAA